MTTFYRAKNMGSPKTGTSGWTLPDYDEELTYGDKPKFDNTLRAKWATKALHDFAHCHSAEAALRGFKESLRNDDMCQALGDLLANLMHMTDAYKIDWNKVLREANAVADNRLEQRQLVSIETYLVSFLVGLQIYARNNRISWENRLRNAQMHYHAEVRGEF